MSRNPESLNREMRQLIILCFLRRAPNGLRPVEIKSDLYYAYPGENEAAIHRRFSDDMADLRRARLIDYQNLRQNGLVKLAAPQKDPWMSLTVDEHTAISRARDQLDWKSATSPFRWDPGTEKLGHVVQVVRLIEEDTTDVGELADKLGVRARLVRQILDRLDGIRPVLEVVADLAIQIERDSADQPVTAGHVLLGSAERPLEGRSLDEIGLFAYSRDEADDRINLIDNALSDVTAGQDLEALQSARKKLEAWRKRLDELHG